jgi:hypothetical protein
MQPPGVPLLQEGAVSSLVNEVNTSIARQRDLLASTQHALHAFRQRRRRWGKGRGRHSQHPPTPVHLLVLGIISNPRTPHTREWIRATYFGAAKTQREAVIRFVVGGRGLAADDRRNLDREHAAHGDLVHIDASDFAERGGIFSCIDKLFAWFPHAVAEFPGAAFYAKADDDSYVDVRRLLGMLRPLHGVRNAYMGYVQYDSFIEDEWKHCGWAAGPVGAAHATVHGCPAGRKAGPFPFVVGALTVMGADLARWMRRSPQLADLVRRGRASQSSSKHWDCGYSDVTLGYALARSNRSISLVSVRDAMRDATYGAMAADRFVRTRRTLRTQGGGHTNLRAAGTSRSSSRATFLIWQLVSHHLLNMAARLVPPS